MKISLVLATIHRTDDIGRLVASLCAQTVLPWELIVVDQNVDDRVVPYVDQARGAGLAVQHLRLDKPNLSRARNLGIAAASGDVIAFPDDDCWYEPDLIAQVAQSFALHPSWSALVAQWVERAQAQGGMADDGQTLSATAWRNFRGGDASSISLFMRATMFQTHGGFDERLGVGQWYGAGEETDFVLRALSSGALIGRCGAARVHHHFASPLEGQPGLHWRAALRRARGTGALYVKHRLSLWVTLRGLFAPPITALAERRGCAAVGLGLAASLGRIQGACAWIFKR